MEMECLLIISCFGKESVSCKMALCVHLFVSIGILDGTATAAAAAAAAYTIPSFHLFWQFSNKRSRNSQFPVVCVCVCV